MGSRNRLFTLIFLITLTPASLSAYQESAEAAPGEYIVKFKRSMKNSQVSAKVNDKSKSPKALGRGDLFHVKAKDGEAIDIEALKRDPDVEYVEPNYKIKLFGDCPTGVTSGCYHQTGNRTYATEAWALSSAYAAGNRPIVAVVDSGVEISHDVFVESSAIWVNTAEIANNGIDDDANGYVDDRNGWNFNSGNNNPNDDHSHGTHVAGIVLGATTDIIGVSPLTNSKIRIMPLKFLNSYGEGYTSDAVSAIYYAVSNGAKVINNSWGGGSYSRPLHEAFTYAYNNDVLIVTAAGNSASNNNMVPMYPANYEVPSNISVAALNSSDSLASFSNFGSTTVHIGAPGSFVDSTMTFNTFGSMSGTSMAAPFVAGAAALAWREAPQLSGYQMKQLILGSATSVSALNSKVSTGGKINVQELMNDTIAAAAGAHSLPTYNPVYKSASGSYTTTGRAPQAEGCGLIAPIKNGRGGSGPRSPGSALFLMMLPILLWFTLRQRLILQ